MTVDSVIRFRLIDSLREFSGVCKNLSDSGIAFVSQKAIQPGVIVAILVEYVDAGLETTMSALVEVTRCYEMDSGLHEICGQIKGIR